MPRATSLALITPELAHGTRLHLVQGEKQAPMKLAMSPQEQTHLDNMEYALFFKQSSSCKEAKNAAQESRKGLLPWPSPTAQHIIACTSLCLPNVTGVWLGQGCLDAAGKMMDAADGCNGAWKSMACE